MTRHLTVFALVTSMASSAPVNPLIMGEKLPELKGEYLTGRAAVLPADASGKVALLLFGFTYQSRFPVEAWVKRFRQDFGNQPKVTFYEVPMIGGMARMGKWFLDSGMRKGTPKADQENAITVYGGTNLWKQRLGVTSEDLAYLVVLDPNGNIVWRDAGPLDETKYQTLANKVRELNPKP